MWPLIEGGLVLEVEVKAQAEAEVAIQRWQMLLRGALDKLGLKRKYENFV